MKEIKIGRAIYQIKKGDYILDNGACFQFCSGDFRVLKRKGWTAFNSLRIPNSTINKINLEDTEKFDKTEHPSGNTILKYYKFK